MNMWCFIHIDARYSVSTFRNRISIASFWLTYVCLFKFWLLETSSSIVSWCKRDCVSLCEVHAAILLINKAQLEMKWSRENASAVLTRHRSAEQEGDNMRPEWWMMHQFPDNATKGYREDKGPAQLTVFHLTIAPTSLRRSTPDRLHARAAGLNVRELGRNTIQGVWHGGAVRSCDCSPCKRSQG